MSSATKHIRHGVGSVRPFLYGHLDMLELVKRAFGAVELEHLTAGSGFHVEAKIGDSVIVMAVSDPPHPGARPASIYVYVDDVDAHCMKARAAGAVITMELTTSDHGADYWTDRSYGVIDCGGHHWWFTQRMQTGNPEWSKVRNKVDRSHHEKT